MDLNEGSSLFEIIRYSSGDLIFEENDPGYFFLIIQTGEVEVYRATPENRIVPLAIIREGQSLGEFAAIGKKRRSASARALTDVEAVKISEEAYHRLLNDLPEWAIAVLSGLVERIRLNNDIIRRSGIVDEKLLLEIEAVESSPDAPTKVTFPIPNDDE